MEQSVYEVVRSYIEAKSGGPTRSFAMSWIERTRNPTPENLGDLVGRFDQVWKDQLQDLLEADDQRLKRELAFLIDRRNRIAHGLSETINRTKACALKDISIELVEWFESRFDPR